MPKDETRFVVIHDGAASTVTVVDAGHDASEVVFTATAADTEAVRTGALDLNVGFMQGRVKTGGDMKQVIELLRAVAR